MNSQYFEDVLLDAALGAAVLEWADRQSTSIPPKAELDKLYPPSERQAVRIKRLFARDRRRTMRRKSVAVARKIAAAVVVSVAILFALLMTTPQGRAAVADIFVTWYEKFVSIISPAGQDGTEADTSVWNVEYVPEGFTLKDDTTDDTNRLVSYSSDTQYFHISIMLGGISVGLGVENSELEERTAGRTIYRCFAGNNGENAVYWSANNSAFCISGNIALEEMLAVAEKIKK
ncbi:hypothetical protein FACS18949_05900 [Clostridia bacterium]|nr:hypothetical protein FACS18949_05900 [Clostridia bacterium]